MIKVKYASVIIRYYLFDSVEVFESIPESSSLFIVWFPVLVIL